MWYCIVKQIDNCCQTLLNIVGSRDSRVFFLAWLIPIWGRQPEMVYHKFKILLKQRFLTGYHMPQRIASNYSSIPIKLPVPSQLLGWIFHRVIFYLDFGHLIGPTWDHHLVVAIFSTTSTTRLKYSTPLRYSSAASSTFNAARGSKTCSFLTPFVLQDHV